jgi:hypothetical protein
VCSAVVGGATPQAGYTAAQQLITDFKDQCMDVSYTGMISQMQNTSLQSGVAGGSRQWVWQTCTEFGELLLLASCGESDPRERVR